MGLTLGSLFDGIAGFPLAASGQGIETIWTSEIEENCIDISKRHFPQAAQLGDITRINGAEIPPGGHYQFRQPVPGLKRGREAGRAVRVPFRAIPGGGADYTGNEGKDKWRIPKIYHLGKRGRGFFEQ